MRWFGFGKTLVPPAIVSPILLVFMTLAGPVKRLGFLKASFPPVLAPLALTVFVAVAGPGGIVELGDGGASTAAGAVSVRAGAEDDTDVDDHTDIVESDRGGGSGSDGWSGSGSDGESGSGSDGESGSGSGGDESPSAPAPGSTPPPAPGSTPPPAPTPTPPPAPGSTPPPAPTSTFTSASFGANGDSYVQKNEATSNFGTATTMHVDGSENKTKRALVQFDISSIPAGSTVIATLTLCWPSDMGGAGPQGDIHELRLVTSAWTETGVTWNNQPTVSGTVTDTITWPSAKQCMTFNVTADVQAWVDGTANNGWRVNNQDEAQPGNQDGEFGAREYGTDSQRPKLNVTYTTS